ncbi:peptidoglycan-binding protein [Streptomyces sp. NBC_01077]|uniref:peptidoglycan-binding domain-containing protein n=1 Tax=Streptomyces sp. NBC_01077 TaxID=2903746 RepID=UPI003868E74A|nr:peptidoglycan-binding protein [Streptomyces sp. NBC_01077]
MRQRCKRSFPPGVSSPALRFALWARSGKRGRLHREQPTESLGSSRAHPYRQNLAKAHEPPSEIDGNFGSGTEAAVKAVQQCSGIKADGQVGPQTWKYLEYPMSGCEH